MQGILLAAGFGRRFQVKTNLKKDKLLALLANDKQPILLRSAKALITALPNSIAVIQPQQIERKKLLQGLGFTIVESLRAPAGMGYAIADAVLSSQHAKGWLIALADMPWVTTQLIQKVSLSIKQVNSIAAPRFNNKRGHPVAFGAAWARQLAALHGDKGACDLLDNHTINWVDWHDDSIHLDIDTAYDLQR